ncbi:MAG: hypothetical protein IMZ46_16070, partial [Acidobacteria bacterium]|nr:hypothetical protein [Acidobacteriota bacterium]
MRKRTNGKAALICAVPLLLAALVAGPVLSAHGETSSQTAPASGPSVNQVTKPALDVVPTVFLVRDGAVVKQVVRLIVDHAGPAGAPASVKAWIAGKPLGLDVTSLSLEPGRNVVETRVPEA